MIEGRSVTKTYSSAQNSRPVLDNADFSIQAKDFIALVGRSGCGKTTLLNLIGALDVPTCGSILFEGTSLEGMSDEERSHFRNRHVGFIFQSFMLLPQRSACDNVLLPLVLAGASLSNARKRALEALEEVGLAHFAHAPAAKLSGGQQQRVAIARAIANRPKLILADEPTGNLDTDTSLEILELLAAYREAHGVTIVIVTHDPLIERFPIIKWTIHEGKIVPFVGKI
ncbi:ATP-binding protein of ABC transporter [Candidatus Sumerlaea chitinivorans]|jgi:putative ABC transport system ATP-binding protein|uniref:ATP-binding protein of ABC transporter n=1 Tax=Sumerlaea chitinivorans TaxID=2250252 RepID=A0A2Z4Y2P9_SUMC1|nr:ATP-binding protein of ABC transporter [Candidatus Sumerlaea chitinivorans]